ncbi:MAG: HlyD family secretion protein [Burkholderiaceae bacterium]|jgi:membrane fusion protein|nr:HlyD family secretion protein [Burkholderiaceae bacterium]
MTESLFRQEALQANKQRLIGTVSLYTPPWRWLMVAIVVALMLSVVIFFIFGSYTKREQVMGQLVPAGGLLSVAPPVGGTVSQIMVREGQPVVRNAQLMAVSSEVQTDLGATGEAVKQQLDLQRARLESDLANQSRASEEGLRGLQMRSDMLRHQLAQLASQKDLRARQADLAQRQLEKVRAMREQDYASNSQVEQQESAVLDAQARLQDVLRQRLDTQQQFSQLDQQLRELPLKTELQRNEVERQLADVRRSLVENESRRAVVLRAPRDGVVAALLVKPGQMVSNQQTAITILPKGSQLEAELMVPSRAIGFVHEGGRVVLRYPAYPYQKFGQQFGLISEVSRTALSPQEAMLLTRIGNIQEQQYRVVVRLERQDILAYGRPEALRPGMAVEADILLDRRHLYEWVLEPLYAVGRKVRT